MATQARVMLALAVLVACHGGVSEPKAQEPTPLVADAAASVDAAASALDAPALDVVLMDPALRDAAERAQNGDFSGAARAIAQARAKVTLSPERACAWSYVEGRMHVLGSEDADAIVAYDAAGGGTGESACPLASYARLRSAQANLRRGLGEPAAARAKLVPGDIALADDGKLALADALVMNKDGAGGAALYREYLTSHAKGAHWIEVSGKLAAALLAGAEGEPIGHAKEVYDLATKIIVEAPAFETSAGAIGARATAMGLDRSLSGNLSDEQLARRAQAWLDSGHGDKAFTEASTLWARVKSGKDAALGCRVASTRAQASSKTKSSTADAWEDAIVACDGAGEPLATALYNGGKAQTSKAPAKAIDHFARLEQLFPQHKLADDARLRGALLHADKGEDAVAEAMLDKLPDDYPAGDMRGDALFRVALAHMKKADWDGAIPKLDRAVAADPNDRHWATAGRAAYFRARAAQAKGDLDAAKRGYAAIISDRPLMFYMLLSFARLSELDAALANKTLADAESREASGTALSSPRAELSKPEVARALRLLEVGELDAAKREMVSAGMLTDSADAELVWLAATLFDRAGAPEIGSGFTRTRVQDHLAHWPKGRARAMWEAAYPKAFEPLVSDDATTYKAPRPLVWGIMREESAFFPEIVSPSAAFGLMQLLASTAKATATGTSFPFDEASLKKPAPSVALGTKLLSQLRAQFPRNVALAIPSYNGGAGAVGRWLAARGTDDFDLWVEEIPWDETRNYTKRVLSSMAAYAYLYDPGALDEVLHLPKRADGASP